VATVVLVCGQTTSELPFHQLAVVVSQLPDPVPVLAVPASQFKSVAKALVAKKLNTTTANQRRMNVTGEVFGCCHSHGKARRSLADGLFIFIGCFGSDVIRVIGI
jgi:hypothetical protein